MPSSAISPSEAHDNAATPSPATSPSQSASRTSRRQSAPRPAPKNCAAKALPMLMSPMGNP